MDWDKLGFKVVPTKTMYVARTDESLAWQPGSCVPYGPIEIHPASGAINYGQSGFEGMKAFEAIDRKVVLFRPQDNARRMQQLADRFAMPPYPVEDFVDRSHGGGQGEPGVHAPGGEGKPLHSPGFGGLGPSTRRRPGQLLHLLHLRVPGRAILQRRGSAPSTCWSPTTTGQLLTEREA